MSGRFNTQDSNENAWVGVNSDGVHRDTGEPVASEFLIQEKGEGGAHIHIGFNENGDEIFRAER
ncbi:MULTISPECIES: hypothetical protein [unclassified Streptomyces]|uniref:hypothetical protein n=1 Tax=unclassified Streptomyces TaxID=2593676 RepID=UPI002E2AD419|nr:hypothetical protein [Streptomyces sp. NBC_00273]